MEIKKVYISQRTEGQRLKSESESRMRNQGRGTRRWEEEGRSLCLWMSKVHVTTGALGKEEETLREDPD